MGVWSQFTLLLWKNWLVQKRQWLWRILEIFFPTFFTIVMVALRQPIVSSLMAQKNPFCPIRVGGGFLDIIQKVDDNTLFSPGVFTPNIICFSPNSSRTREIMNRVIEDYSYSSVLKMQAIPFDDEETMVQELADKSHQYAQGPNPYLGAVVFDKNFAFAAAIPPTIEYKIRLSNTMRNPGFGNDTDPNKSLRSISFNEGWETDKNYNSRKKVGPRNSESTDGGNPGYWREGFLTIQKALDNAITGMVVGSGFKSYDTEVFLKRFPHLGWVDNPFVEAFQKPLVFPLILVMSMVISVLYITRNVVHEKEARLKEYMKVMGLSGWLHWVTHFLTNIIKLTLAVLIMTVLLWIEFNGKKVIDKTDPTIVFCFLWLYAAATIWYSFAISTLFMNGNTGACCAGVLWILLYIPYYFLNPRYGYMSYHAKMYSCLMINTNVAWGANLIGIFEGQGKGLQWDDFWNPANRDDNFAMSDVFIMLCVNIVIFIVITWYMDAVYPGDQGIPQRPWFFILPSYWCPGVFNRAQSAIDEEALHRSSKQKHNSHRAIEPDPAGAQAKITVYGLTKVFRPGLFTRIWHAIFPKETEGDQLVSNTVVAVKGLSVRMFPGQITALLGHNGAGKSTTMSMLTGLIPPTSGTALINGFDIRSSLPRIRKSLGLCPQYNTLFSNLTVKEHLVLFCRLKDRAVEKKEINSLLVSLGLKAKKHSLAKTLSGGMKRKLSVGIALVGGSEIVLLDEPTSGMDPGARHEAWRLLQTEKRNRTILLTTHFMEEADLLGDRICILARGQLRCCGSGLFLKNKYGAGYHLTVVFEKDYPALVRSSGGRQTAEKAAHLLSRLRQHCAGAELEGAVGAEAAYILPNHERDRFKAMFAELESNQSSLGVQSFGVSITTMEEVFMKVGHLADAEDDGVGKSSIRRPPPTSGGDSPSTSATISRTPSQDINNGHTYQSPSSPTTSVTDTPVSGKSISDPLDYDVLANMRSTHLSTGVRLRWQQLTSMLHKRLVHSLRNWPVLGVQLILPVFFVFLAITINLTLPGPHAMPPLLLDPITFGVSRVPLKVHYARMHPATMTNGTVKAIVQQYTRQFETTAFAKVDDVGNATNVDNYMIDQYREFGEYHVDNNIIIGAEIYPSCLDIGCQGSASVQVIAYWNNEPLHGPGITLNAVDNAILNSYANPQNQSYRIKTVNHPLPPSGVDELAGWLSAGVAEYFVAVFMVLGMSFLSSSFVVFLVKERSTKSKHLQLLSGLPPFTYWLSAFVWDYVSYVVPSAAIVGLFALYQLDEIVGDGRWTVVALLLLGHGWAVIPMIYAASFLFDSPGGAFVKLTIYNILTGLATMTANTMLVLLQKNHLADTLDYCFQVMFPGYTLGQGFQVYYINEWIRGQCSPVWPYCDEIAGNIPKEATSFKSSAAFSVYTLCCDNDYQTAYTNKTFEWEQPGIGKTPVFMALQGVVFWLAVVLIEIGVFRRLIYCVVGCFGKPGEVVVVDGGGGSLQPSRAHTRNISTLSGINLQDQNAAIDPEVLRSKLSIRRISTEDAEVVRERGRMLSIGADKEPVLAARDLTKYYGRFRAVDALNFGITQDECFGLLGVNGAGKTSTFQMLTGENYISGGTVVINGVDLRDDWKKAGKHMGYCPQFDALIDQMTGRETLAMYANLRGVPSDEVDRVVGAVIKAVDISRCAERQVRTFSGGNKRRLSVGVALLGLPDLLLLDEPTTGVDPTARRAIWNILGRVRQRGTAIVLTSHSMDECEALCTRLAIMAAGRFRCLGAIQQLKSKYGSGYTLQIKVANVEAVPDAIRRIRSTFPNSILHEIHHCQLHYELSREEASTSGGVVTGGGGWSRLFGALEALVVPLNIVDYSLSQTTLERVFLEFSRDAYNETEFDADQETYIEYF